MKNLLAVVAALAALTACMDNTKVTSLVQRMSDLEAANKALTTQLGDLKFQIDMADWDRNAFLRPGDDGYVALRYDLGVVTVKIADIKPYANGSKISLKFGNLTSARVNGLKATLDWGRVNERGLAQNETAKSREVTFDEPLPPGTWTLSEVVLEGIPPADLGFVRLRGVGHRGVGLRSL